MHWSQTICCYLPAPRCGVNQLKPIWKLFFKWIGKKKSILFSLTLVGPFARTINDHLWIREGEDVTCELCRCAFKTFWKQSMNEHETENLNDNATNDFEHTTIDVIHIQWCVTSLFVAADYRLFAGTGLETYELFLRQHWGGQSVVWAIQSGPSPAYLPTSVETFSGHTVNLVPYVNNTWKN